jgi:hypothetical protein
VTDFEGCNAPVQPTRVCKSNVTIYYLPVLLKAFKYYRFVFLPLNLVDEAEKHGSNDSSDQKCFEEGRECFLLL